MQHYFEAKAHLNMEHFNRQNDITTQNNQTQCVSQLMVQCLQKALTSIYNISYKNKIFTALLTWSEQNIFVSLYIGNMKMLVMKQQNYLQHSTTVNINHICQNFHLTCN